MPICLGKCFILRIFAKMKQNLKHIGIIVFLQLICCALYAQRFVNASIDGAQTIYSIIQDEQGLLWIGTENGLYSYDGYHSYRHYTDHTVSNTRVNALALKDHLLYMATGNGMLTFDTNTYFYTPFSQQQADGSSSMAGAELRAIDLHRTYSGYGSEVYALLNTDKGLLVGTLSGLFLVKGNAHGGNKNHGSNGKSAASTTRQPIPLGSGIQPLVNALAYDAKRRCYWIGTEGALYRADLQLTTFTRIPQLNGNSIKCLAEETNGTLYIGTDNGLYSMAADGNITHYMHDSRDGSTIPNNIVWACYVDQWQNVWVGTDNGLSRLSTHTYYQYTSLDRITLSGEGNCLHEICQTRNGEWWLGGTNGLIHKDKAWYKQNSQQYPLSHNRVRKIYEDADGDVWVCTDHGVNVFNRQSQQMHNVIVYDNSHTFSTAWAYDILMDKQGRMWIASYMGGVFVIGKSKLLTAAAGGGQKNGGLTPTVVADRHFATNGPDALSGLHIGQLVMDGQGHIWASSSNHLDCIDPQTMKVTPVTHDGAINYLMADVKGNVWIGGNTKVTCFLTATNTKSSALQYKTWNLGSKVVTMCDVDGKTWVVTGRECSIIDMKGKSFRFKIPSSLAPLTMYWSKTNGKVVMGGNDGYVTLRDDLAMKGSKHIALTLTGIVVNGRIRQNGDWHTLGDTADGRHYNADTTAPSRIKKLVLENGENNFTLQLTDFPFADHPSAVYAYRLEGSDHDWHHLNRGNLNITYNGLSHGSYHLTVHMVDGEGQIGAEAYSLDIVILPPWYLTLWAKLFYLLLAVAIVWGIMKFYLVRQRLAEERRQKSEILQQVEARMNFFNRLSQDLKRAVAHRSFDEIINLTNRYLGVQSERVEVEEPALSGADQRLLKEITEAIEVHMIDSEFNVTTLQEVVGMGGKQLYRKLKAMTGKTPVEYIREIRMHKASLMLKEGKFSVSEVMYTVGFTNSSYFSKCFSKTFGMTPTEYMKQRKNTE